MQITRSSLKAATALIIFLASSMSYAENSDREAQLKLVQTKGCASCHGTKGQGNPSMKGPRLSGQTAEVLTTKIKAYRDGKKKNPTMRMMTYSLSDHDIERLSAYFSQFP